ncbi:MAG: biotin--[acetyl-CoA-carboxylase] ligase [Chloroflexota bacterium]|nr:biotin--[acetyl-CoA-carboxylase] ligase [Chloroflexota bacterium]
MASIANSTREQSPQPDGLTAADIQDGLRSKWLGRMAHCFQSVESTQDAARQLALGGQPEGDIVVAEEQVAGRGRMGREFFSPRGGIWCSIILRPKLRPERISLLSLAAGLAAAEGVSQASGLQPVLKWPNDLLINERKVCGILIEMAAGQEVVHHLIVGLGINVNLPAAAFPPHLSSLATSLLIETGHPVSRKLLLQRLLERLERRYEELSTGRSRELLEDWKAWPNTLGRNVRIQTAADQWEGRAEDLDRDGSLLVRLADGSARRAIAGDVHLLG